MLLKMKYCDNYKKIGVLSSKMSINNKKKLISNAVNIYCIAYWNVYIVIYIDIQCKN
jgi:hypothetical protein